MEDSSFWIDKEKAQKVITESNALKAWALPYREITERFSQVEGLLQQADTLGDQSMIQELEAELAKINKELEQLELRRMLSHELDPKNAFLSINAGAGGTESCDWVVML